MTIEQAKSKLLAWVSAQVGTHEGANNWNKYAEDKRLAQLYGWDAQNQPWCDLFTDAAFISCFGLELGAAMTYQMVGNGSAACRTSAQFFREHGAFSQYPEAGDVVFFFVSGAINHQGIVMRVAGGSVVTVEGNSSDQVSERVYQIGDSRIAGYGRPDWQLAASTPADDPPQEREIETCEVSIPTVRKGDTGAAVAALQAALKHVGFDPVWIDGEAGERTEAALRAFQEAHGIEPHGICGAETWEKLMQI